MIFPTLLIDAGNTRVKWAITQGSGWLAQGALTYDELTRWGEQLAPFGYIPRVLGVHVIHPKFVTAIEAVLSPYAAPCKWIRPEKAAYGLQNRYQHPEKLGADRWAALIGARALFPGDCLVVTAGTATTIDQLTATGDFLGGYILPGVALMGNALTQGTAQLPKLSGALSFHPQNTADAIFSGILLAQVGAIECAYRAFSPNNRARILLGGGAAPLLAPALTRPYELVDNLPLRGIDVIAQTTPAP